VALSPRRLDAQCAQAIEMHCIGGFAVTLHYGRMRPTGDIDVWHVIPSGAAPWLTKIAGEGTELHRKHRVHVQVSAVATVPEDYESRLVEVFAGEFKMLRILVLDPYDLALSKLERNAEIDIEDVKHLARALNFDLDVLAGRYRNELRPFLTGPERDVAFVEQVINVRRREQATPLACFRRTGCGPRSRSASATT
jgi:hypothetical protein